MTETFFEADPAKREARLDAIREVAAREGRVEARGLPVVGGPLPPALPATPDRNALPGYFGHPIVKPPVWSWEVPVYFFVGGLAGMAAVIAFAAIVTRAPLELARCALWIATGGALASAVLLILDLGRPSRFFNMLRVFKWRSPMSVGSWTLSAFGGAATVAAVAAQLGAPRIVLAVLAAGAALLGGALATYTGVLLAATAIPAWFTHRRLLPVHFGVVGLGCAAALLEVLGFRLAALNALGLATAGAETLILAWLELRRHGPVDRALHHGRSGLLLRASGALAGPLALGLRAAGRPLGAAASFLIGALVSRFGWVDAGRASALDPEATLAAQAEPGSVADRGI